MLAGLILLLAHNLVRAQLPYLQKSAFPVLSAKVICNRGLQDHNGYIWLGSDQGLFRFDGINYKQYFLPTDSVELNVTALHEGPGDILWIGCKDGRIYRLEKEVLSLFDPEEGTAGKAISDIVADHDGVVWWSTKGEGIYFSYNGRVFNINHDDGLNDDNVYDLECDHDGLIWAGTDAGISLCRQVQGQKSVTSLESTVNLPDLIVKVIREDLEGRIWLGFQDGGVGYLLPDRSGFINTFPGNKWSFGPVQDIINMKNAVWVATSVGELLEISPDRGAGDLYSLKKIDHAGFGKIDDLLEDSEGNVWILSNSGLFRSTGTRLKFLNQVKVATVKNIHAIWTDINNDNKIWFSNDDGLFLLNTLDGSSKQYLQNIHLPTFRINCIYQDHRGYIWAGTFNYGVFRIDPEDGSWSRITEEKGLINDNVLSISGHHDTLWMATLGGASELIMMGNEEDGPFSIISHNRDNGLVNNFIYSVYEDEHDQIWFATDGDGISVLTKKGWITFSEQNGLNDDVIYSITGDTYENIWIATASGGVYKYDGVKFQHFGLEDGLSSLDITGITTSSDEVIIVHDDGLNILHIPSGRIAQYGEEIGLAAITPDLNVISKDSRGNVWIGTRTGIIRYQPGSKEESYSPRTVLEEMLVYLEPRPMMKGLSLGFSENHVSFKYAGLWFSNPGKVTYQVTLEGYDIGWKDTYDRLSTYSSLPPGHYTFRVRSSLDKSFRNVSEAAFDFRIKGPFWLSSWFIILVIIILTLIVFFIIRYREERTRRIEQEKKEKVEFEFQLLKNQVNPHFLFNSFSTLMSLIEEQPEQALQYTEKLSDFFRTILQLKDQQLIPLEEELTLSENYFFLLKKRFGDNLNLEIILGKEVLKMAIPPMTLQILIENAVKHNIISKDSPLFIKIYKDENSLVVENNYQPKITAAVSTGIGLENIRKRYRMIMEQEPEIEKTEAYFRVKLPCII